MAYAIHKALSVESKDQTYSPKPEKGGYTERRATEERDG
jgi:hypothetical protein